MKYEKSESYLIQELYIWWRKYWVTATREHTSYQSKMAYAERVRDYFEAAHLQTFLEEAGYELVYVDEFHVSMKSSAVYNWSFKGCPSILSIEPDPWIMSFVVALSRKHIEGILASSASINSKMFIWFMKDLSNIIEKEEGRRRKKKENLIYHW